MRTSVLMSRGMARRRVERQVAQADTALLRLRALRARREEILERRAEVLEEARRVQLDLDDLEEEIGRWSGVAAVFYAEAIAGRKRNPEVA